MSKNLKRFLILSLVLILFLLPIGQALSKIEALQGGKGGLIVVGVFVLFSITYWIVMLILTRKKKGK